MKVLIDTNILISAALDLNSTPGQAFFKAVTYPNKAIICEQNLDELRRIFNRKFPNKLATLEAFLAIALTTIEIFLYDFQHFHSLNPGRDDTMDVKFNFVRFHIFR